MRASSIEHTNHSGRNPTRVELEQLGACGMTPLPATVAATPTSAERWQAFDRTATDEPCRIADLVVLEAAPIADAHIGRVRHVISAVRIADTAVPEG